MNMKYLITLPLILFSLFSHSEDELDKILNDFDKETNSGIYYCISEKSFYISPTKLSDSGVLEDGDKFSVKIDLKNQMILSERFNLFDPNEYVYKLSDKKELDIQSCSIKNRVMDCYSPFGTMFSFNTQTKEYMWVVMNNGRNETNDGGKGGLISSFGSCEKFD